MSTAAIIGGTVAGGLIGAHSAGKAANTQAAAAEQASQLQYQESQNALDFQKQTYNTTQQQLAPWLNTGTNAINELNQLMGMGGMPGQGQTPGAPGQPFPFPGQGGPGQGGPGQAIRNPDAGNFGGPMPMQANSMRSLAGTDLPPGMQSSNGQFLNNGMFARGGPMNAGSVGFGPNGVMAPNGAPGTTASGVGAQATVPGTGGSAGGGTGQLQPFTSWNQQFVAPNAATEQNDPGYQFRLQQGQQALENSAAARGGLLSGGTAKAEQQYGQDYASNEYSNVYNRALGEYQQNYNIFQNNQNTQFNRLASLAGLGQTSAAQLGGFGQQAANNAGNIFLTTGAQQGQDLQNAAAARASGYVAQGNAYGGIFNNLAQYAMLSHLS